MNFKPRAILLTALWRLRYGLESLGFSVLALVATLLLVPTLIALAIPPILHEGKQIMLRKLSTAGEWFVITLSTVTLSVTLLLLGLIRGARIEFGRNRKLFYSLLVGAGIFSLGRYLYKNLEGLRLPFSGKISFGVAFGVFVKVALGVVVLAGLIFIIRKIGGRKMVAWLSSLRTPGAIGAIGKTVVLYGLLNLLVFILFPDKYGTWMYQLWFWQFQGGIAIVAILLAMMTDTRTKVLGYAGALVLGIWMTSLGWTKYKAQAPKENTPSDSAPSPNTGEATSTSWNWNAAQGPEKDTVMLAFPGDTLMWRIAAAESDFTQFRVDASGDSSIVQNRDGVDAFGIFQIRKSVWGDTCGIQGFDIMTTAGNIGCAKIIRSKYPDGRPWLASAHRWRDSTAVDPCERFARYGGSARLDFVRKDTVIAQGDGSYTRRISTEGLVLEWEPVNFRTDYIVRYGYQDPISRQEVIEEQTMVKENCDEENRLSRYPLWVEFRARDLDPVMIEITFSKYNPQ